VIFVCGDADGFPDSLRERVKQKLSLSAMTYSHELARVMLASRSTGVRDFVGEPVPQVIGAYGCADDSLCGQVRFAAFREMMGSGKTYVIRIAADKEQPSWRLKFH